MKTVKKTGVCGVCGGGCMSILYGLSLTANL